jgi:hypothetical protein
MLPALKKGLGQNLQYSQTKRDDFCNLLDQFSGGVMS